MKKGDFLWLSILLLVLFIILSPLTKGSFINLTSAYPYITGFFKFALLATMGELLAIRMRNKKWLKIHGLGYRAFIWGFIGVAITLIFVVFASGVDHAISNGYLPGRHSTFLRAFYISTVMNIIFAPTMMGFHKLTDSYLDLTCSQKIKQVTLDMTITNVNWHRFIKFVLLKTIPFFWIPAHTITFLLPSAYRVVMAALLSIILGILLSIKQDH